jgi:hypothetical protein
MSKAVKDTLGYHRDMAAAVFGEDSKAVVFMDKKIKESPRGRDEPVIAAESQIVYLLARIHYGTVVMEGLPNAATN